MKKIMQSIQNAIEGAGIPYAYNVYPTDDANLVPTIPYVSLQMTGSSNFFADDAVYYHGYSFELNLFTNKKDVDVEETVMAALDSIGIVYTSTENYDSAQKMYLIKYSFEMREEV